MDKQPMNVVAMFANQSDADRAVCQLRAANIDCILEADDCGGMMPTIPIATGIRLLVPQDQAQAATELLGTEVNVQSIPEPPPPVPSSPGSEPPQKPRRAGVVFLAGLVSGALLVLAYQRAEWHGDRRFELDENRDGKVDAITYYRNGVARQFDRDRNGDGNMDETTYFDDGIPTRGSQDDNFDGSDDCWATYTNGSVLRVAWDLDFDGKPDAFSSYRHDVISQTDYRPASTNDFLLRQVYQHGVLREELWDSDRDGFLDVQVLFDPFHQPVRTNRIHLKSEERP